MKQILINALRWLAILPASFLGAIIAYWIISWLYKVILFDTFSGFGLFGTILSGVIIFFASMAGGLAFMAILPRRNYRFHC